MSDSKHKPIDRSKEKYFSAFMLGFWCLMLTLLPIMFAEHGYFIFYGDYNAQQIPFYNLANDAARSGNFGWNWYTDLGTDFMTSYSFYLFGSPYFRLSTLLPRGLVTFSLPVLLSLKHGVASLTAYAYIRRFVRNKDAALIGGMLYACSGFQLFNIFFNHFQDVTSLFPLMLIAMEENINCRRKGFFAIITAVMAVNNYYFFTGQAVFLIIYYLFRMVCPDFHTSWKKFLGLLFEAAAGTMLAAFVLLPSAYAIISNYRVNEHLYGMDMVLYPDKTLIPRLIQTFFMIPDAPARPNLFNSDYEKWASIGGYLPFFSMTGVITFMGSRKKHWASRLISFCIICAFIPALNSLFQAANSYYYARWFYMPILIMAMMTAHSLDDADARMMSGWRITAAVTAVFVIIGILPEKKDEKLVFFRLPEYISYFWVQAGIAVLCLLGTYYIFVQKSKRRTFMKLSVFFTAAASLLCTYSLILFGAYSLDSAEQYISSAIEGRDNICEEVDSNNFFRVDISEDCDNYPMLWKLPSIRSFHSVVNTSIMDFYDYIGIHRDVASRPELNHYTLRGFFSVKYYYKEIIDDVTYDRLKNGNYSIPAEHSKNESTNYAIIPDELEGFRYAGENGRFEIYENTLYIPMGFAYDTYIPKELADSLSKASREKIMMDSLIFENSEHESRYSFMKKCAINEPAKLTKTDYVRFCHEKQANCSSSFSFDEHSFTSTITLDKPMMVFFSVPYSEGWTAEVNGKAVDVEKVNKGFMAVPADKGDNTIVFRYKTPYLNIGIIISLSGAVLLAVYLIICYANRNKGDKHRHTHYYDYSPTDRIKACEVYNNSFAEIK